MAEGLQKIDKDAAILNSFIAISGQSPNEFGEHCLVCHEEIDVKEEPHVVTESVLVIHVDHVSATVPAA